MPTPNQHQNIRRIISQSLLIIIGALLLFFIGFIGVSRLKPVMRADDKKTVTASGQVILISEPLPGMIHMNTETSRIILRNGISFLESNVEQNNDFAWFHFQWPKLYWRLAGNVLNATPLGIVQAQLSLAALYQPKPHRPFAPKIATAMAVPTEQQDSVSPEAPTGISDFPDEAAVLIYHTHTTESYIPVSGKAHLPNSQGDIVKVGAYLQKELADKYRIRSLHCETIHDSYPFRDSYKRSQVTVRRYLAENASLKVVLDVHRDATPGVEASCQIHGEKTAKIMFVVGSDKMGLPHPHWRKNLQFAQKLTDAMNLEFPGLCSGIVISDARYNQHLHDHALIVEFGDQDSTLTEAYRAVDYFVATLIKVLKQENDRRKTVST